MPDWDNTESRERDEDAAWRDLIARFGAPPADGPVPWPEREDVPSPRSRHGAAGAPGDDRPARADEANETRGAQPGGVTGGRGNGRPADADRVWRALEAEGLLGQTNPDVIRATRRSGRTPAERAPANPAPPEEDEEHFVPPEPLPLPKLDPVTKGAWAALFGGPGYLMVATALHWSVPGYAAFCAVAAFVTGFALLVLRMNDPGPGGPGDGDNGAVV